MSMPNSPTPGGSSLGGANHTSRETWFFRISTIAGIVLSSALALAALWLGHQYQQESNRREIERDQFAVRIWCLETSTKMRSLLRSAESRDEKLEALGQLKAMSEQCSKIGQPIFDAELPDMIRRLAGDQDKGVASAAQATGRAIARSQTQGVAPEPTPRHAFGASAPEEATPVPAQTEDASYATLVAHDLERMFDQIMQVEAESWVFDRYEKGSVVDVQASNVGVTKQSPDPSIMYLYGRFRVNGGTEKWAEIRFANRRPECIHASDAPGICRGIRQKFAGRTNLWWPKT